MQVYIYTYKSMYKYIYKDRHPSLSLYSACAHVCICICKPAATVSLVRDTSAV